MVLLESAYEALVSCMGANEKEASLWKADHDNAMSVFDCEDLVNHFCESFDRIDALHCSFVEQVLCDSMRNGVEFSE